MVLTATESKCDLIEGAEMALTRTLANELQKVQKEPEGMRRDWTAMSKVLTNIVKTTTEISTSESAAKNMASQMEPQSIPMTDLVPGKPAPHGALLKAGKPASSESIMESAKDHLRNTSIKFLDHTSDLVLRFLKLQHISIRISKKENQRLSRKLGEIRSELEEIQDFVAKAKSSANNCQESNMLFYLKEAMARTELVNRQMLKDGEEEIGRMVNEKKWDAKVDTIRSFTVGVVTALVLGLSVQYAPVPAGPFQSSVTQLRSARYVGLWSGLLVAVISSVVTLSNLTAQLRKLRSWNEEWRSEFKDISFDLQDEASGVKNLHDVYTAISRPDSVEFHRKRIVETLGKLKMV